VAGGTLLTHLRGVRNAAGGGNDAILALDAGSGRTLWQTPARNCVAFTLAADDGRICYHDRQEVVCLGLADGKERWRATCEAGPRGGSLMIYRGVVVADAGGLHAFDAETGKPLWQARGAGSRLRYFGAGGLVWVPHLDGHGRSFLWTPEPVEALGHNPRTGEVTRTVTVSHLITPGHHVRCYPAKATERFLLLPKRGVEFVDLVSADHMRHNWLRGSCGHGATPANGLLYMPPHQCFCYPGVKVTGFNAVSAEPGAEPPAPSPDADARLVRGPAYGKPIEDPKSMIKNDADWPTYRHDALRSGRAGCDVPADVRPLWQRDLGGPTTQPVVAGGLLVTAERDGHTVHALDATTGKPRWRFTAEGRIDSAPTCHAGRVLFGSADGRVYCLRAADGALAWRFRAAPRQRRIAVFDQLESAWPVHGSVLVQNGVAYCTAGRSSFLDGGIRLYALDPATGKVLHERHIESERPDVTKDAGRPFDMDGTRTDVLVSDGSDLYMFFQRFGPDLAAKPMPRITKLGDREVGLHLMSNAGLLDTSWFDRNYWSYSRRWPGYYFSYSGPKSGQILVFDDEATYGLHVFAERAGHSPRFHPGRDGYELFADGTDAEPVLRPTAIGREKGAGYSRTRQPLWSVQVPVQFRAMVLAGERLFAAGPPDAVPADDAYAAFEGRLGARLWVVATDDGRRLAEYELDRPPVFDGLMAAGGRLYLALDDGRIVCMGPK
jgi:outer membrane protein assembly factor BamB